MKCAICHKPRSFDQCPILNDIPYIKKHFISYCLLMNKRQKQMLAAIHCINVIWGTDINDHAAADDNDKDSSNSNTDNDNDADFQEKEQ